MFEAVADDLDPEQAVANVLALAGHWLRGIDRDDLERLLVPRFAVELPAIKVAIEVPRSVLVPLAPDGSELPGHWRLGFTTGGMRYDSRTGFDIAIDKGLTVDFPKAMIPKIGITLAFDGVDVDLSRTSNIAAADAEGRPPNFMGVSIERAEIGLPKKWFSQPSGNALGSSGASC